MDTYSDLLPSITPWVKGVSPDVIADTVRNLCRRFCKDTGAYVGELDADDIVADQEDYALSLPDDTSLLRVEWVKVDDCEIDPNGYEIQSGSTLHFLTGYVPGTAVTDGLTVQARLLPDRNTDDVLPDWFLTDWQDGLIAGVRAELHGMAHLPCYDPIQYAKYQAIYESESARAKLEGTLKKRSMSLTMHSDSWL